MPGCRSSWPNWPEAVYVVILIHVSCLRFQGREFTAMITNSISEDLLILSIPMVATRLDTARAAFAVHFECFPD